MLAMTGISSRLSAMYASDSVRNRRRPASRSISRRSAGADCSREALAALALKSAPAEVPARVGQVLDQVRALEKELATLKGRLASSQGDELLAQAVDVKGLKVLAARLEGAEQPGGLLGGAADVVVPHRSTGHSSGSGSKRMRSRPSRS